MTQFDLIVCFITLIFMTLGLFKGAIRSILGLGKWYGAGVLTILFYPKAQEMVAQFMQPGMIVNGIAVIITYIVALITLSILIGIFVKALGGTVGGPGDKLLGAAVGVSIGVIIASTGHYFIRSLNGMTDPGWIKGGTTYPITAQVADRLNVYFKDIVNKMGVDMGLAKNVDPTGDLANKIKMFQNQTGTQVDFEKLKEAVRMMKGNGMNPDQIKDAINIQDYSFDQGAATQGVAKAMGGDMSGLKQINGAISGSLSGKSGGGSGAVGKDYYESLRTYDGPGNSREMNADGN